MKKLFIILLAIFFALFAVSAFAAPYANSTYITGITWDNSSYSEDAPGSDNWPVTWSDDGDQYVVWGDGGGFSDAPSDCRVSLGVGTISGTLAEYQANESGNTEDLYGCTQANSSGTCEGTWQAGCGATYPAQWDGKSYGIISINGDLYMWWGPGSCVTSFGQTRLLKSTDHGQTWTKSTWNLIDADKTPIMPTILNFGQDYASAKDSYVYHYFIRCEGDDVGDGSCDSTEPPCDLVIQGSPTGYIDLARVLITDMENSFSTLNTKFEWFEGMDGDTPIWGTPGDKSGRVAVFTDANGVGWNLSVSYNIGLGRYLLITEHTESMVGNMGIFDAPEPWGPWTTVAYYTEPNDFQDAIGVGGDVGSMAFFWNFSQKWTSGTNFALIWTGNGMGNVDDSFNVIEGTFTVSTGPETFYVCQGADGSAPETDSCATAWRMGDLDQATNWSSIDANDGKVGPGDIVYIKDSGGPYSEGYIAAELAKYASWMGNPRSGLPYIAAAILCAWILYRWHKGSKEDKQAD